MTATSLRITDVLLNMIATLLAPLFLTTTGDVDMARAAALATVRSYTARNPMDLLLIGQMIALSLATISSVSLSMRDDVPINLILRLRGNALSLYRAGDKCRGALPAVDPACAALDEPVTDAEPAVETEIITEVQRRERVADDQASVQPQAAPSPTLLPNVASIVAGLNPEKVMRAAWTEAFPDATQAEIDAVIKEALTEFPDGIAADPSISFASPPPR